MIVGNRSFWISGHFWVFLGILGISGFFWVFWVFLGFLGFSGFSEFFWVFLGILGISGFFLVFWVFLGILGISGFFWVFLGFLGFSGYGNRAISSCVNVGYPPDDSAKKTYQNFDANRLLFNKFWMTFPISGKEISMLLSAVNVNADQ